MRPDVPDLRFLLPAASEEHWADLLATLVATDPGPIATFVGVEPDEVRREVAPAAGGRRTDRLDVLLLRAGTPVAAVETRVLHDLRPDQLRHLRNSFPDVESCHLMHLGRLPAALRTPAPWHSLTWEEVLTAYAASTHAWVATTARAALARLHGLVPVIGEDTVWNDVPDDPASMEIALRARVGWLAGRMDVWCRLDHDLDLAPAGAWMASMWAPANTPGHRVVAELSEGLPPSDWRPEPHRPFRVRLQGPSVLLGLHQQDVTHSRGFDWLALHDLFRGRVVDEDGTVVDGRSWVTTPASPRDPDDRAGYQNMVALGAPRWLGKGHGMATARSHGFCAFGARFRIAPGSTMLEVEQELKRLEQVLVDLGTSHPSPTSA